MCGSVQYACTFAPAPRVNGLGVILNRLGRLYVSWCLPCWLRAHCKSAPVWPVSTLLFVVWPFRCMQQPSMRRQTCCGTYWIFRRQLGLSSRCHQDPQVGHRDCQSLVNRPRTLQLRKCAASCIATEMGSCLCSPRGSCTSRFRPHRCCTQHRWMLSSAWPNINED